MLANAGNRRAICESLGQFFHEKGRLMPPDKGLLVSGCFGRENASCCFQVNSENVNPLTVPDLYCDHEETDTRAFFFIANSPSESISLVISFDTDLINIGLSTLDRLPTRTVIYWYNRYGSDEKYCHLNKLLQAVEADEKRLSLQLLSNQRSGLGKILTSFYVVLGNDQMSHIYGIGKKTPLQVILRPYRFCLRISR